MAFVKHKTPISVVGDVMSTSRIAGILELWKAYWKINSEIRKNDEKLTNINLKPITQQNIKDKNEQLIKSRDALRKTVLIQEERYRHYVEVNKKYHELINT